MEFLVVYATVEGHTQKIAESIAKRIEDKGTNVRLVPATERIADLKLDDYAGVIFAAPVYQQRHPDEFINLIKAHAEQARHVPTALVSVSISAAFPDGHDDARAYVDRLEQATGWQPQAVHLAAGALRIGGYDFFQEQIIRHVVLKDRAPNLIEGHHDFTDWDALGAFIDDFVGKAGTGTL
jgi:menaquinone-dependent protoporphyrinogen oxidase